MTLPVVLTAGTSAYNIQRSLRFRSSASAYLNRTLTTPTSSQKFTWSGWVKRGKLDASGYQGIFAPYSSGTVYGYINWSQDGIRLYDRLSGGTNYLLQTTAVYRDPSAWYHIVYAVDTTQATASNRVRLYVNGVEVTSFSTSTYPTQNNSTTTNSAIAHYIGYDPSNTGYFDGYLTEVYFIDGQALTPSSFGQTDSATGVWQPAKYTGTYGTNGFYLPFTDTTSTTTISEDFSGNNNDWTSNNISLTSGATYDSMTDVPTLTDTDTANYCVLNPLSNSYSSTTIISITDGNLNFSDSTSTSKTAIASMTASSGKWYFEMTSSSTGTYAVGLMDKISNAGSFYRNNGTYSSSFGGGGTSGYSSWTSGDVIGVAWDADAGKLWFAKNNTWQSGSPSAGTSPTNTFTAGLSLFADIYTDNSAGTKSGAFNFGQRPFAYTPPTGFVALNTFNLPTPTIGATASSQANKYMDISLYTGTGSSQSITGLNFQPDWTWIKGRSGATDHGLYDAVRGVQKQLESNNTDAETTETTGLTAFNSNGFTVGALAQLNTSSATYVGWNWKANGSGSSNTDGSITSTVSANTTAGFSIVTYTGNATSGATVGHGLGVAPSMVIVKSRSAANNWCVYHISMGNQYATLLNTTAGSYSNSNYWNNTSPTSTLFSLGNGNDTNQSSATFVAYCFAQVAGYSAFGSYTGNGSSDGTFVYLGFRPSFILVKRTDSTDNWVTFDNKRDPYNVSSNVLLPNLSNAESSSPSSASMDFVSNGFKIRASTGINSGTWIYMAFAENPFKYSLAR